MKLSLFCLMHYCNFDKLVADKAISVNQTMATCDVELAVGCCLAIFHQHIGIRFYTVTQNDIDVSKTFGKVDSAGDNADHIDIKCEP